MRRDLLERGPQPGDDVLAEQVRFVEDVRAAVRLAVSGSAVVTQERAIWWTQSMSTSRAFISSTASSPAT
jgi:hypothetical protein